MTLLRGCLRDSDTRAPVLATEMLREVEEAAIRERVERQVEGGLGALGEEGGVTLDALRQWVGTEVERTRKGWMGKGRKVREEHDAESRAQQWK